MSIDTTRPARVRRSKKVARETILVAAEKLLVSRGPQSLKLSEVAATANVVNATVVHHFGTIDGVQTALMERMVSELARQILAAAAPEDRSMRVELVTTILFDAFEAPGSARLAAWLELTGEFPRLKAAREAMDAIVDRRLAPKGFGRKAGEDLVLVSAMLAMAVGLFGPSLTELLGREPGTARRLALDMLRTQIAAMRKHP